MTSIARLRLRDRGLRVCLGLRVCAGLRIRGGLRICAGLRACGTGLLLLAALTACLLSAATSAAAATPEGAGAGTAASGGEAATPASAQASDAATVPRLLRTEPPRDSAHHIGDLVTYRALIAWPPGWDIDRDGLRAPTRENGPIELRGHSVQAARGECADCRWLSVDWQLFKAVQLTSDLALPASTLRLRKGSQTVELRLPASRLAVSPLVPWERRANWVDSMRPGWQAGPLNVRARLTEAGAWLAAALLALAAWAWSSGRWLPRRASRPFARAWRSVQSRRPRAAPGGQPMQADAQDLRCWHRAFDATAGEALFAERLDAFFAAQPAFAPLAREVRAVFAVSQRAFFLAPGPAAPGAATGPAPAAAATGLARQDLVALLRRLADCEFGAARAARQASARRADVPTG